MTNEVAVIEQTNVLPVVSAMDAKVAMQAYQELCRSVLDTEDFQKIGSKEFKKKSAFRKLSRFYALSVEEVQGSEKMVQLSEDNYAIQVTYRATSPSGQCATGDGACEPWEKPVGGRPASYHVTRANAHTRAFNRAVSNLVAMGEVSADEMSESAPPQRQPSQQAAPPAGVVSEAQARRLYAIAKSANIADSDMKLWMWEVWAYKSSKEILRKDYETICKAAESGEVTKWIAEHQVAGESAENP